VLEISGHMFESVLELQNLLCNSFSLKDLTLRAIQFKHQPASGTAVFGAPRVVLSTLRLMQLVPASVESLVTAFTAVDTVVDATHLRTLHCDDCSIIKLMRANPFIREVTIRCLTPGQSH
jgi:hypothetical protein